jgi:hypothetical protein
MAKNEKLPKANASEIEALIERFKGSQLKPGDAELIERLLRTVVMLLDLLERKNLSIKKLKAMIFGPRTERRQTTGRADEEKSAVSEEKKSESATSATEQEGDTLAERSAGAPQCGHCPVRGLVWIMAIQTCLLPLNHFKDQPRSTMNSRARKK